MNHGFKTLNGTYKHLTVVVIDYCRVIWSFKFYDRPDECFAWFDELKEQWPKQWHAVYQFNSENPLKEQAVGAVGTVFSRILCNIIDNDLADRSYKK